MANYPQELAQDAVCQNRTGHMIGLWFLPARPLRLNTNEWMNEWYIYIYIYDRLRRWELIHFLSVLRNILQMFLNYLLIDSIIE